MLHTAYFFDVEQFRDQVKEYLDQLDKGVYEPLYRKYRQTARVRGVATICWRRCSCLQK